MGVMWLSVECADVLIKEFHVAFGEQLPVDPVFPVGIGRSGSVGAHAYFRIAKLESKQDGCQHLNLAQLHHVHFVP